MVDFARAFAVINGLSLDDINGVFAGSDDPSVQNEIAPQGSLFLRDNGQVWYKFGASDNEWRRLDLPTGVTSLINVDTALEAGGKYMSLATSVLTHTLPTTPNSGDSIQIAHARVGDATVNNITIDAGGNTFAEDGTSTLVIDVNGGFAEVVWNGINWFVFNYSGITAV